MLNEKLLKITLAFIIALILVGFWTIRYMLKEDASISSYENMPSSTKASNVSTDAKEVSLDTIYINIRSQKFKIMKADIALVMKNNSGKKALKANMENVRNAVLQYLNAMNANGLETLEGKERLKGELISMLEETFGYEIETIYLKNFILSP